jgi:hypothetical protein
MRKLLGWIALILLAIWVINNPVQAATEVRHVTHALSTLVGAL